VEVLAMQKVNPEEIYLILPCFRRARILQATEDFLYSVLDEKSLPLRDLFNLKRISIATIFPPS
jgi:hypothetical protein